MAVNIQKLLEEVSTVDALENIARTHQLTENQKIFVREFVQTGGQKTKAMLSAGYIAEKRAMIEDKTDKSPEAVRARASLSVQGTALMKSPKVQLAIQEYSKVYQSERRNEIETDVFRTAKLRATYDIRRMTDSFIGKSPEDIADRIKGMTEEDAMCIDSITFKYWGKDADKFTADIKFADKDKSIALLAKLAGLMVEKKEVTNIGDKAPQINIQVLSK